MALSPCTCARLLCLAWPEMFFFYNFVKNNNVNIHLTKMATSRSHGMHMHIEVKNLIVDLKNLGLNAGQISRKLKNTYDYSVTRDGVYKFLKRRTSACQRKQRRRIFNNGHQQVLNSFRRFNI